MPGTEPEEIVTPSMEEANDDLIPTFIEKLPFKIRPDDEKLSILQKGRPTPKLLIIKRDTTRNCNRTFQESWYFTHKWLCGSSSMNKLYCWPCLLMRPETSSWCSTGTDDIKRLSTMTSKHALSKAHIKSVKEYDATLVGFGLMPEFTLETTCKRENEGHFSDSDFEFSTDSNKLNFNDTRSSFLKEIRAKVQNKEPARATGSNRVSFKTWQDLTHYPYPIKIQEDKKLLKLKRKLARREIRNVQLTNEKLNIELELLRAKLDYQNHVNNELGLNKMEDLPTQVLGLSDDKLVQQ